MASFSKSLALAVEKHPVLYNPATQAAAKKDDYDDAWDAVAYECNKTTNVVKSRWNKTIKNLIQHTAASALSKTQARKTRSSDFEMLEELKFVVPFIGNNTEAPVTNPWDSLNENDTQKEELISTNLAFASTPKTKSRPSSLGRNTSTSSNDNSKDALMLVNMDFPSTSKAAKNGTNNDKRKLPTKPLNNNGNVAPNCDISSTEGVEAMEGFFVSEPVSESSSSIRFRRIVEEPAGLKQKDKNQKLVNAGDAAGNSATKAKQTEMTQNLKLDAINKILHTRSRSMCLDRKAAKNEGDEEEDDGDADYQLPVVKKQAAAQVKVVNAIQHHKARGRKRNAAVSSVNNNQASADTAVIKTDTTAKAEGKKESANLSTQSKNLSTSSGSVSTPNQSIPLKKLKMEPEDNDSSSSTSPGADDNDNSDDIPLLEVAAAAGRSVFVSRSTEAIVTADAGTQYHQEVDEEDEEFLSRMRLWLQRMNPRQKLVFRKGVLQAVLDVYDDPRNFQMKQSAANLTIAQLNGMPALFSGMSPVELRLVRQLAIAVAGNKHNNTPVVPPKVNTNKHEIGQLPTQSSRNPPVVLGGGGGGGNSVSSSSGGGGSGSAGIMHPYQQRTSSTHSQARKTTTERPPAVLRTTAIALSNQIRSPSGTQRMLRKVVRVDNTNGIRSSGGCSANNSNDHSSSQTGNSAGSVAAINSQGKQRVYRILPNGSIMRHISSNDENAGGNSNSPNGNNTSNRTSPIANPTVSTSKSTPTSTAVSSSQAAGATTSSTLTSSTGTVINTRNIRKLNNAPNQPQYLVDPQSGIKRLVTVANDGSITAVSTPPPSSQMPSQHSARLPIARRFSICSIPHELKQQQSLRQMENDNKLLLLDPKLEPTAQQRTSLSKATADSAAAGTVQSATSQRPIVRVRYAPSQKSAGIMGTSGNGTAPRPSGSGGGTGNIMQFALPNAVGPRNVNSNVVPVAVKCAGGGNSETILKRAQEVYETALLAGEHTIQNYGENCSSTSGSGSSRQTQSRTHEESDSSIITPDLMVNFVVKNEPLEQDEDNELLDDVMMA